MRSCVNVPLSAVVRARITISIPRSAIILSVRTISRIRRRTLFLSVALFETFVPTTTPIRIGSWSFRLRIRTTSMPAGVENDLLRSYARRKSPLLRNRWTRGNMFSQWLLPRPCRSQPSATLAPSPHKDVTTARRPHPTKESVHATSASFLRLVGSFWHKCSISIAVVLSQRQCATSCFCLSTLHSHLLHTMCSF